MKVFTKQELDKILDNHNLWLSSDGKKGKKADLSYANLSSVNLSYADLRYMDLSYTDLSYANLSHANLRYTNLKNADLSNADLNNADLRFNNLHDANLHNVNLSNVNLSCTDLSYANLRDTDLNCANLSYADLSYADLSNANLNDANLSNAKLRNTNLHNADLRNVNLDFSAFPFCCGSLNVNIDDKIAIQLLYHFVRNVKSSPYTSKELKSLCKLKSIIEQANKFHRVSECGIIEEEALKQVQETYDTNPCSCYEVITRNVYLSEYMKGYYAALGQEPPTTETISRCNGTAEQNICYCGGDRKKCTHYPENRK